MGKEVTRNNLWVSCSSHKNADEFTFAEFLRQHLVSLFPCQLMRNLSTYVAYCGFSLLAPLAVGSMLSTGKGEAREAVTRNKAQGFFTPTPCSFWWIILPMCFRSDWALWVWTGLWRMESDMFRAGTTNMTADCWPHKAAAVLCQYLVSQDRG